MKKLKLKNPMNAVTEATIEEKTSLFRITKFCRPVVLSWKVKNGQEFKNGFKTISAAKTFFTKYAAGSLGSEWETVE